MPVLLSLASSSWCKNGWPVPTGQHYHFELFPEISLWKNKISWCLKIDFSSHFLTTTHTTIVRENTRSNQHQTCLSKFKLVVNDISQLNSIHNYGTKDTDF